MNLPIARMYSPQMLALLGVVALALLSASSNFTLWAASFITLPFAVWFAGGEKAYPVLVWIIGMFWLQLVGDIIASEILGLRVGDDWPGVFRIQAILLSFAALLAMAYGIRSGRLLGTRLFGDEDKIRAPRGLQRNGGADLRRAVIAYFAALVLSDIAGRMALIVPGLSQPLYALALLKWVAIYVVAARTFETRRDRRWLALVLLIEVATGMISYFSSYKESIFIVLMAMAASRRRMHPVTLVGAVLAALLVVWMSMIWSTIKNDYRLIFGTLSTEQRIEWIYQRYTAGDIDYQQALLFTAQRVGYTTLFSQVLAREDIGALPANLNFYRGAIEHIITPRILFPDKPILDDTRITNEVLGMTIGETTSVGLGYTAQAYIDFGFPGLLVPLWVIGLLIGYTAQYFMTRPVPVVIRAAVTIAVLLKLFAYETNIDKELGAFVMNTVVMVFSLKVGYPMIARWLTGPPRRRVYEVAPFEPKFST